LEVDFGITHILWGNYNEALIFNTLRGIPSYLAEFLGLRDLIL
jgi:hypothetical protein